MVAARPVMRSPEDRLIDRIYDAAIQPAAWAGILDDLLAQFHAEVASIGRFDVRSGVADVLITDCDQSLIRAYHEHYHETNLIARVPDTARYACDWSPLVSRDEDWVSREELERSEYFDGYLRPLGAEWGMFMRLGLSGTSLSVLDIGRAGPRGRFEDEELAWARLIHPHLIRARALGERFLSLNGLAGGLTDSLDRAGVAMLLLDEQGRLLHANVEGERLLADGSHVRLAFGRVTTASTNGAQSFAAALAAAAEGRTARRPSSLQVRAAGDMRTVTVSPLPLDGVWMFASRPILVTIGAAERPARLGEDALRASWGFTPAEARVAVALAGGLTITGVAERHGTSVNTVRRQLGSLFAKTDTSRQVDLVRLLMSIN